eukprot:3851851-Lingulodinium_polyedra.AAC.1
MKVAAGHLVPLAIAAESPEQDHSGRDSMAALSSERKPVLFAVDGPGMDGGLPGHQLEEVRGQLARC